MCMGKLLYWIWNFRMTKRQASTLQRLFRVSFFGGFLFGVCESLQRTMQQEPRSTSTCDCACMPRTETPTHHRRCNLAAAAVAQWLWLMAGVAGCMVFGVAGNV
jgi:hypothetical protein